MPKKASKAKRKSTRKAYQKAKKTSKLGAGKRFKALKSAAKAGGARDPGGCGCGSRQEEVWEKALSGTGC